MSKGIFDHLRIISATLDIDKSMFMDSRNIFPEAATSIYTIFDLS